MSAAGSSESRDAGILVFGRFVAMLAEAAMPFLIVRLLGKAEFGAFSGLMMIYSTLSVVLTAGFPAAVLYFLADREAPERAAITRRLFGVQLLLGAALAVFFIGLSVFGQSVLEAFGRWIANDPRRAGEASLDLGNLAYFSVFVLFDIAWRSFPNFLIAEKRARGAAAFGVLRAIGMSMGTLVPAALGAGVLGIIGGLTIFGVVQGLAMAWTIHRIYRNTERTSANVDMVQIVKFGFPLGLTEVVSRVNAEVDKYLILAFMTVEALAEYRVGAWQIPVISIPYSVGHVYTPRFVQLIKDGRPEEVMALWQQSIRKVALIVVPVAMVFIVGAEEFVQLGFTGDYARAAPVFRIYSLITMARVASFGAVIVAAGRSPLVFKAAVVTLLSNIVLSVPALFIFGFEGPAIGTAVAFIPMAVGYCYYIARALGLRLRQTFPLWSWLKVVTAAVVASVVPWILKLEVPMHPALALVAYVLTLVPVFVLVTRTTGLMTAEDLQFALRWLRLDFMTSKR
ncbi:MAG: oligosaccharide flippase family protein [Myxococcota bacterium]